MISDQIMDELEHIAHRSSARPYVDSDQIVIYDGEVRRGSQ